MIWPVGRFEQLVEDSRHAIVGGPFGSKLTGKDYVGEGVPVIRGANMSSGRYLGFDNFVFVSEEKKLNDLASNTAKPLDLVFTQRGTLGQVAIIPDNGPFPEFVISQSQMKATLDPKRADRNFYYYYFSSNEVVNRILNMTSSSGVPHINLGALKSFEVPVPPIDAQKRIASILSAYDDLIENNRRRIVLLEETARLLYREWFVHFRFPGHEHVKIFNGVPKNFEISELGDFCRLRGGNAFKTKYQGQISGELPFIKVGDMNSAGNSASITEANNWVSEIDAREMKAKAFPVGTVVFAKIGEALKQNRVRILVRGTIIDNNMMGAIPDIEKISPNHLYQLLSDYDIAGHASGAAVPFLTAGVLSKIKFPIPDLALQGVFNSVIEPIQQQITNLQMQITATAKARDLLLPRLMDGRLEV